MKSTRIGCAAVPARMSRRDALERLEFVEEDALTRPSLPTDKVLRKWRSDASEAGCFTLIAGSDLFGDGPRREAALEELLRAATILEASAIVFRPPAALAPSQGNRDRFRALIESEATRDALGGAARVLCPQGLWDLDVATALAAKLDVLVSFDPLGNDPLEEIPAVLARTLEVGSGYFRLDRIGTTRRTFDSLELETLAQIASELETSWFAFAHHEKIRDGQALRAQINALLGLD